jgi:hypothetical protein
MMDLMQVLAAVAVVAAIAFAAAWLAGRDKLKRIKAKSIPGRIRSIPIWELDEHFAVTPTGPKRDTEIPHIAGVRVEGGVSDLESWILCNLAKPAKLIFEFGTATGKTTYLMARSAPQAKIVTLTLAPDQVDLGQHGKGDDAASIRAAKRESAFQTFVYSGSDVEPRIDQRFGDSKVFDESPYAGAVDLIFLDGDHTESYVRTDTHKALNMLRPGGWLLWHDYRGRHTAPGVWRYLNQLAGTLDLVHIQGTAIVAYRKPS